MKLLHIDASILGGNSVSRQLSAAAVEWLRKATPGLEVTYRDISSAPLSHLSGARLLRALRLKQPRCAPTSRRAPRRSTNSSPPTSW